MKKISAFILIFLIALATLFIIPSSASDDFITEDGVLMSYVGKAKSVSIPDDVFYIADGAFKDNTTLTSVNLNNVSVIGNEAFYGCTSLSSVKEADNVSSVGAYAFYGTPFLDKNKVVVLNNVAVGGKPAGDLVLDDKISAIAPYAFSQNTAITSLRVPETLNTIGEGAFFGCTSLERVKLNNTLSYIGPLAFQGTAYLNTTDKEFLVLGDGILVKYSGTAEDITLPDNVKQIAGSAFYGNKTIKKIAFTDNVSYIGMRSFMNCTALDTVAFGKGLKVLDKEAFAMCTSLKKAVVPESVELVGDSVYYGCSSVDIAEYKSQASVPDGTFAKCTALRIVILNHNIERIGDSAFLECSSLSDIPVPDSVNYIGKDAFSGAVGVTVSCNSKSYANSYCADNGINTVQSGDANLDGKVNIRDATYIQKYVASMVEFTSLESLRAEANFDGKINIRDATYIQKLLAALV